MARRVVKFYHPKVSDTGWHKNSPVTVRRARMLIAHNGNRLAAGRAMQALANVTTDKGTASAAAVDARYFFRTNK